MAIHGDGRFGIEATSERDEVAGWWRAFDTNTRATVKTAVPVHSL
jgi:hypothetical protein